MCANSRDVGDLLRYTLLLSHVLSLAGVMFLVLTNGSDSCDLLRHMCCLLPWTLILCHQVYVHMCHRILGWHELGHVYHHVLNHYMLGHRLLSYVQSCVVNVVSFLFVMCSNTCSRHRLLSCVIAVGLSHVQPCIWLHFFMLLQLVPACFIMKCSVVMFVVFSYVFHALSI